VWNLRAGVNARAFVVQPTWWWAGEALLWLMTKMIGQNLNPDAFINIRIRTV
jgi:hypothetical protein